MDVVSWRQSGKPVIGSLPKEKKGKSLGGFQSLKRAVAFEPVVRLSMARGGYYDDTSQR